jgi:hypothetical protein
MIYGNLIKNNSINESYETFSIDENGKVIKETVEVINELKAKPINVEKFNSATEAMNYFIDKYISILETYVESLNAIIKFNSKGKGKNEYKAMGPKEMESLFDKCVKLEDKIKEKYASISKDNQTNYGSTGMAYKQLYNICKTFNVKYSDEMVEIKKKYSEILLDYQDKIIETVKDYVYFYKESRVVGFDKNKNPNFKELDNLILLLKVQENTSPYALKARNMIIILFTNFFKEIRFTLSDIMFTSKLLNLGIEKKLFYKFVNKIFKSEK